MQGPTHDIAKVCQAAYRLREMIQEHTWNIKMLSTLKFFSEFVVLPFSATHAHETQALRPACLGMRYS